MRFQMGRDRALAVRARLKFLQKARAAARASLSGGGRSRRFFQNDVRVCAPRNELTPARRGTSQRGQGRSSRLRRRDSARAEGRMTCSQLRLAGFVVPQCERALMRLATPDAASQWPMFPSLSRSRRIAVRRLRCGRPAKGQRSRWDHRAPSRCHALRCTDGFRRDLRKRLRHRDDFAVPVRARRGKAHFFAPSLFTAWP